MSVLGAGFKYDCEILTPSGEIIQFTEHNLLPQVSVDHLVGLLRGDGTTPISSWFMGLFENNYVPTSGVTSADLPGVVGESTAYTSATRPVWTHAYDGVSVVDNIASKAVFTFNATNTIYGAFIVSSSVKAGNTGVLLSIARFNTAKTMESGTQFSVAAGITLVPTT
jgi:hypothetical protein